MEGGASSDAGAFGRVVKRLREERRLSQSQLAERAGLTAGYIAGIELGVRGKRPPRDTIITLARALDVPPLEMLVAAERDAPADHDGRRPGRPTFEQFVTGEHLLREDEKEMLIRLYRSYVGTRAQR